MYNETEEDDHFLKMILDIMSKSRNFSSNLSRCEKYRDLKDWILEKTQYLFGKDDFYTLGNRIFYIVNDIHELPRCTTPGCNKIVKHNFTAFTNKSEFFMCHCSIRCT